MVSDAAALATGPATLRAAELYVTSMTLLLPIWVALRPLLILPLPTPVSLDTLSRMGGEVSAAEKLATKTEAVGAAVLVGGDPANERGGGHRRGGVVLTGTGDAVTHDEPECQRRHRDQDDEAPAQDVEIVTYFHGRSCRGPACQGVEVRANDTGPPQRLTTPRYDGWGSTWSADS